MTPFLSRLAAGWSPRARLGLLAVAALGGTSVFTSLASSAPRAEPERPPALVFVRVSPPDTPAALFETAVGGRARRLRLPGGTSGPAWSRARRLLAFSVGEGGDADLYLARVDGTHLRRLTAGPGRDLAPVWSPDGSRVAFVRAEQRGNRSSLWVVDADGRRPTRLTRGAIDLQPSWAPDGRTIAFLRLQPRTYESSVWLVRSDGANVRRLTLRVEHATQPVWSPKRRELLVTDGNALVIVRADGRTSRLVTRLATGPRGERRDPQPSWSNDGRWIAFTQPRSATAGRADIWVVRADGTHRRRVTVSPGIDSDPCFRD